MKTVNTAKPLSSGNFTSSFDSDKAFACLIAGLNTDLMEPELIAWYDSDSAMASPVLEGCSGPMGWRDYAISHGGCLEVKVGKHSTFIFAESSPYDSYEHFGHGPFINIRNAQGNEMICRVGGINCMPLDEWTSKLT